MDKEQLDTITAKKLKVTSRLKRITERLELKIEELNKPLFDHIREHYNDIAFCDHCGGQVRNPWRPFVETRMGRFIITLKRDMEFTVNIFSNSIELEYGAGDTCDNVYIPTLFFTDIEEFKRQRMRAEQQVFDNKLASEKAAYLALKAKFE